MNPNLLPPACLALALLVAWDTAAATELAYTPVNPTFGGNPNNAAGLLGVANAQNNYKAPVARTSSSSSAQSQLDLFTQQLQRAVLDRLTSVAISDLFDANGRILPNRTVTAGNFVIAITTDAQGNLVLTTQDKTVPGSSTQIVVGNVTTQ